MEAALKQRTKRNESHAEMHTNNCLISYTEKKSTLTNDINVGVCKDGSMLVGGLTLVYGSVTEVDII